MHPLSALTGLNAVGFLARFSYALARNPVLPLFALFLGAGPEAVGLAVGVSTVTGIFFKMPAGAMSDVIGRKRTMLAGLFVFGLLPFAYLFISDYQALVAVRFIHGLATAIYGPVAMAVVAEMAGERRGEMLSWFSSVMIVGTLLGAPIGGWMLHHAAGAPPPGLWDFRMVFLASGAAGMAALLLGLWLLRGPEPHASSGASLSERLATFRQGLREVMADRRVLLTSAMEGVQNLGMGALEAFLPIYAVTRAGLNELEAGMLWAVQIVMTMLSKPILGRLGDSHGRKAPIAWGLACCAVGLAAVPWLSGFWTLSCAALIFGLGEALVTSSSAALVADLCRKRHYGAAMGTFGTIFDVGHASGPILGGLLVAALDFRLAFAALAVVLLAAIPVFLAGVSLDETTERPSGA
ncbi:MAG TPA: MFS transporter [Humidesulfovibrio sp.]|uniref:MFS transporter n=1 Tax=Humidesulfovibrio sp. TaxID=2910988 RepID=UPI002BFAC210|nr:MFS transporter [Humidesulfovibrio sp.]HWR04120.1 MFS transporter [Humidesulfovibrio sp.]